MSDENDNKTDGKPQGGTPSTTGPRAPLSLRPRQAGSVSTGTVKQSFSHGRSKTVVVETKRRVGASPGVQRPQGFDVARNRPAPAAPSAPPSAPRAEGPGGLSAEEMEARRRAIELANRERAEREAQARAEQEKAARDAAARKDAEAAAKAAAEAPIAKPVEAPAPKAAEAPPVEAKAVPAPAAPKAEAKTEAAPAPTPAPAAAPAAPKPDLSRRPSARPR